MNISILSRGQHLYSTQSIVEAARGRGHQVRILDYLRCHLHLETGKSGICYGRELLENVDAVIPRIGASITHEGAAVIRQFESMGVCTLTPSVALVRTRDKLQSFQHLVRENIPVPNTILPAEDEDIHATVQHLKGFPLLIKQLESTHGVGVLLADSYHSLKSMMEMYRQMKIRFVLQEFIRESAGADIRALVVGKRVVAAMERKAPEGEFRSNLHRGGTSRPVGLTGREEHLVKKACKIMGLEVAGVDILRSERGPLIMEVNASPGLEGIESTTGVDIAFEMVRHLEKLTYNKSIR